MEGIIHNKPTYRGVTVWTTDFIKINGKSSFPADADNIYCGKKKKGVANESQDFNDYFWYYGDSYWSKGYHTYIWENELDEVVATTKDLIADNILEGIPNRVYLTMKDQIKSRLTFSLTAV